MQKKTEISKKMGDEYPARNHENNFGGITNIKITNNNVGAYPCGRQINVKTCGRPVNAKNYVRPINANVTHLSNNSELLMGKGVSNTTKTCSLLTNNVVGAYPCGRHANEIKLSEKGADVKFGNIKKVLLFCAFLCVMALGAQAQTWNCGAQGNNLTATLSGGTLTISGSGTMKDYDYYNWALRCTILNFQFSILN